MFSSRAFVSRSIRPQDDKSWTTYISAPDGQRQSVVMDMSHAPVEDLDFPVLFPILDAANHDHNAKVDWTFDPGRFSVTTVKGAAAGAEICNNYGPKGNDELLLGYGFCLPSNPYDTVAVTLKAPAECLQQHLRNTHSQYFTLEGTWLAETATFSLKRPSPPGDDPAQIFHELPEPLLELLLYILRDERGLQFSSVETPTEHIIDTASQGRRYLPHIARMLVQFLAQKSGNIQSVNLPPQPQNQKQEQAAIYRQSQINILTSLISALRTYLRSLIWSPTASKPAELPTRPCLMRLESFLTVLMSNGIARHFLRGIEASANTQDLQQLRVAGWEEDLWVLLLCYLALELEKERHHLRISEWFRGDLPAHVEVSPPQTSDAPRFTDSDAAGSEQASSLMDIVHTAASTCPPGSIWSEHKWAPGFIAGVGGKVFQHESFVVMIPREMSSKGDDEARLCLYLHCLQ